MAEFIIKTNIFEFEVIRSTNYQILMHYYLAKWISPLPPLFHDTV